MTKLKIDERILSYLEENGFEKQDLNSITPLYIKKYKGWYICVNPAERPVVGSSREMKNFRNISYYDNLEKLKARLENLDEYIAICEERESD